MLRVCVLFVDGLGEICVKLFGFCPAMLQNSRHVEKHIGLTTVFARLLPIFFHARKLVFISVMAIFLPIINIANKNNNYIILNFNYWRMSA